MGYFRKKPVVIEAMQLLRSEENSVRDWIESNGGECMSLLKPPERMFTGLLISTLEGQAAACFGDWVIRGVKGEFYPCRSDIFEATYDEVENADAP